MLHGWRIISFVIWTTQTAGNIDNTLSEWALNDSTTISIRAVADHRRPHHGKRHKQRGTVRGDTALHAAGARLLSGLGVVAFGKQAADTGGTR